jgi:ATP-dependent helicase/nuclease subunit A
VSEAALKMRFKSSPPPDQAERSRALDPRRSFLVQAPAGSGKTHLLTQRFLRLLAEAEKPEEIVAITFTKAAAAEMRNRILAELERAERGGDSDKGDPESLTALAGKALERGRLLGWQLLDQPSQLRITTIDAFCRGLALQCPLGWGLLSGLGGKLETVEDARDLYRRAARRTIETLGASDALARESIEALLLWRDNHWKDVEDQIVEMLGARNRWYQDFVFARDVDWVTLRRRLEAPFLRSARGQLESVCGKLGALDGSCMFALELARFACEEPGKSSPLELAAYAELPGFPLDDGEIEGATAAFRCLASFLLTKEGTWRSPAGLTKHHGFPAGAKGKTKKDRFGELVGSLAEEPGLEAVLAGFLVPIPTAYTEEEWELVRHCFAVLRTAAVELQLVFAETGSADFTEVAQIALRALAPEDGFPSDFAMQQADGIRHLLIDEFQDTSRNQHLLLSRLIAAWPDREGRSCFCVGDPMQSIYGFREAEVELFERLKTHGLEIAGGDTFQFEFVSLRANFRTEPTLVEDLNGHFGRIFAEDDGSGVRFSAAEVAREAQTPSKVELHLAFTENKRRGLDDGDAGESLGDPDLTREAQLGETVELVRMHLGKMAALRAAGKEQSKYRIAVLGRTKKSLTVIAQALREAGIGFRAIELVPLRERSEVLDALSLARALLNPTDRTAWLGVLRAPWCGLALAELHLLTSADDVAVVGRTVAELLDSRLAGLLADGVIGVGAYEAADRVRRVLGEAVTARASGAGETLGTFLLGTWLESVWKALGGVDTVNAYERENLRLLWSCLDKLPAGEVDLLGPALGGALDKLFALPDPAASSDFGVQLMTIHKSKGLEFEVVLVPDLEAVGRNSERAMISWLERGLASSDEGGELTEFLIAPIQSKGEEASSAKLWVEGVKRARETQEMRRLLYVAATRARQELHLFARPRYSVNKKGEYALAAPGRSLLGTAWPSLREEVEGRFAEWLEDTDDSAYEEPETIVRMAASAVEAGEDMNLGRVIEMPVLVPKLIRPTILRRLPEGYVAPRFAGTGLDGGSEAGSSEFERPDSLFARTEGGLRSRLEGIAVHQLLERLSRSRESMDSATASEALVETLPATIAMIRGYGVPAEEARKLARRALAVTERAAKDPVGAWVLSPHAGAASETKWTGLIRGQQWNLQPDRVFLAPHWAQDADGPAWWIIDYKTTHAGGIDLADDGAQAEFIGEHRDKYAGQLAVYAQVIGQFLRNGQAGDIPIRVGIYYPRLPLFDWWTA